MLPRLFTRGLEMNKRFTSCAGAIALLCGLAGAEDAATAEGAASEEAASAEEAPSVSALGWMTGTWAGPVGPGELEENWTTPKAGSIQALVRMTGDGKTSMVEMIVIEEEEGSLTLRLQQWDPGYKPRTPEPSTMKLVDLGDNTVAFEAISEAEIAKLRYTRNGDNFTISIENAAGAAFDLPLKAR